MEVPEPLVVGAVTGAVHVEQGDDQSGLAVIPPDAAGRLDVFGRGDRLAHDHHQAKARDVEPDRDHVGRDRAVDPARIAVRGFKPAPGTGDLICRHPAGELDHLVEPVAAGEQAGVASGPDAPSIDRQGALDLFLDDPPGTAELAQAVEVAEDGHVGIGGVVGVPVRPRFKVGLLGRTHQGKPNPAHHDLGTDPGGGDAKILACRHGLLGDGPGEEGVAAVGTRWREDPGICPAEQRLHLR